MMAMEPMELIDFSLERIGALWGFALGVQGLACWYWFAYRARRIIKEAQLRGEIDILRHDKAILTDQRDEQRMNVARLNDAAKILARAPTYKGVPIWQQPPLSPLRAVEKDQLAEARKDRDAALEKVAEQYAELTKVRKMVMSGEYRLSPSEVVEDFSDFLRKTWPHMNSGALTAMAGHYCKAAKHSMLREGWRRNSISVTLPPEIPRLINHFEGWTKAYGPQGSETRPCPTDGEIGRTALAVDDRTPEHKADEQLQRELTCSNCGHFHYVAEDRTLRA